MGNSSINSKYYMDISIIGESIYLFYLYLTRNIYIDTKAFDKKEKKTLIDYWDFHYSFNQTIQYRINEAIGKCKKFKENNNVNINEALIVHVPNKNSDIIDFIFSKIEEQLEYSHYMPMILFLSDENDANVDFKINPDSNKYPDINKNKIYTYYYINEKEYRFSSEKNELTEEGQNKMEIILGILHRFCSYLNDLGDRFSIGEKDHIINYDLCNNYFPFTINICCIGRPGKGKSTCVNFILDEEKSKESNSGASTTKEINYYQVSNQPIKIYDIPGFENKITVENTLQK